MQAVEVKRFLEEKLPETQVEVEGEGCNFQLNVISDELSALSPVNWARSTSVLAWAGMIPCSRMVAPFTTLNHRWSLKT